MLSAARLIVLPIGLLGISDTEVCAIFSPVREPVDISLLRRLFKACRSFCRLRRKQSHITGVLHTWDVAIEKIEQLIFLKEKRALAASQFLYLGSMPEAKSERTEDWLNYSFGDIFEEVFDKNPGLCANDVITVGKYAIRPQSEHFSRSVASKELSSYLLLRPGDFVYDPMSAYYGAIGRYTRASPGVVSPAYRVLHLRHGFDASYIDGLL